MKSMVFRNLISFILISILFCSQLATAQESPTSSKANIVHNPAMDGVFRQSGLNDEQIAKVREATMEASRGCENIQNADEKKT